MMLKKAQQEIIGFVLIVVVVSVIGLILLGFSIETSKPVKQNSLEISNLLQSIMYSTTDCAINFIPQYKDGEDLIKACYENQMCLNGKSACKVANSTFVNLIQQSLNINSNSLNKGFKFNVYYVSNSSKENLEILNNEIGMFGNCSSNIGSSYSIVSSSLGSGIINAELEICRG